MKDRILPDHWSYRPGTWDWNMYDAVVVHNEYQIPNPLPAGALVIDVGAHIGSFSWAAHLCGASHVVAVELCKDNFAHLCQNLAPLNALCLHGAVWHDTDETPIFEPHTIGGNTGGYNVYSKGRPVMYRIGINALIAQALAWARAQRVALVKLDCEGSEYPILVDADLSAVESVCLEVHDGFPWREKSWTAHDLVPRLVEAGFQLRIVQESALLWKIWGTR